jgi:acyl dehydratase
MNTQPLHINEDFAAKTEYGRRIVNGLLTMSLVIGMTVADLTDGTIVANLGYENIKHPHPVFHGDTIYADTTIVSKRESKSRPNCGIVTLTHFGKNQDGVVVVEVTRSALFLRRGAP